MKKPGKAIKKIDKKVPAESKKEKITIESIATLQRITPDALIESTGFEKDGAEIVVFSILRVLFSETEDTKQTEENLDRFFAAMTELKPRDGFEGLLISQMINIYKSAMRCFEIANLNQQHADYYFKLQNQAIKLMRLYSQQLETLDKHRNKGRQKMTVEHVHVYKGGQAIVGEVTQGGMGVTNEK